MANYENWRLNPTWQLPIDVAKHLDSAEIPHLLWQFGPDFDDETGRVELHLKLIVPDDLLDKGNQIIAEAGFSKCTTDAFTDCKKIERECELNDPAEHGPIEATHFHGWQSHEGPDDRCGFTVALHPKSSLIWDVPDLPRELPERRDPYFSLTTISRPRNRSRDPWFQALNQYPFMTLQHKPLTDAYFKLALRDWNQPNGYFVNWDGNIDSQLCTVSVNVLRGRIDRRFRVAWDMMYGDKKADPSEIKLLREKLLKDGILPEAPVL